MKKIFILATLSMALFASCSDFLEQDNKSNVPGSDYYATPNGYQSLVNAAYSSLRTLYGKTPFVYEGGTDLFASGRTAVNTCCLYGQNYSTANDDVTKMYVEHYKAIALANEAIYWGEDNVDRASSVAQARGLRAFYYLTLAQHFGGVPLITERSDSQLKATPRATMNEILDFVISELKEIATGNALPATGTDGRFNKAASNHYLALAYLYRGYKSNNQSDFQAAIEAANAAGAGKALSMPFATLFSNAGEGAPEVLFYVGYSVETVSDVQNDGNRQQADYGSYLQGSEIGHKYTTSTLTPTLWMHDVFNTNTDHPELDERYEATFMTEILNSYWDYYDEALRSTSKVLYYYCPSWKIAQEEEWKNALPSHKDATIVEMIPEGNNAYNEFTTYEAKMTADIYGVASFRKFDDVENGKKYFKTTSSMRDIYLARLAETNLIAAEACIKLNQNDEAAKYINVVRNRAKATPATGAEMSIDYLLNERARELAGEYHRWTDLTRTGKLIEYVEAHNPDIPKGRMTEKFNLRPIPLSAMQLNEALTQNPGWE